MSIRIYDLDGNPVTRLYQWDVNQTIRIYGVDLTGNPSVHFANLCGKHAYVATPDIYATYLEVLIPNGALQDPKHVIGYVVYPNGVNGRYTRVEFRIPITARAKPENYTGDDSAVVTVTREASGNVVTANTGSRATQALSAVIHFAAEQFGSGAAAPDNIRSIRRVSYFQLCRAGSNLWDNATKQAGYISMSGAIESSPSDIYTSLIPVSSVSRLTMKYYKDTGSMTLLIHGYNGSGNWVSILHQQFIERDAGVYGCSVDVSGVSYVRITCRDIISDVVVVNEATYANWLVINREEFGAYTGTYDIATGLFKLTHAYREFDGTETWGRIAGKDGKPHYFYCAIGPYNSGVNGSEICSHWSHSNLASTNTLTGVRTLSSTSGGSNFRVAIRPENAANMTVSSFKSYLRTQANNGWPLGVLWKLKTPETFSVTPRDIQLLAGTNTVWSPFGKVDIKYTVRASDLT